LVVPWCRLKTMSSSRAIRVVVNGDDHVLRAGVATLLRDRREVVEVAAGDDAQVAVLAGDGLDEHTLARTRRLHRGGDCPVVLVLSRLDDAALLAGVDAGASGFVHRSQASPDRLARVVVAVSQGEASVPPDLVSGLLTHLSRVQASAQDPAPAIPGRLSVREVDVLRLASEGLETAEIARRLSYSERTVKGVIHDITSRFQLKNRTHAVAFAVRLGLI
jgi:DNA-binding NarL/FixJ family response regulator